MAANANRRQAVESFDFRIAPLGEDMLLRPFTPAARNWIFDNLPKEERRLGAHAVIAARDIPATLTSILQAGLTIAPHRDKSSDLS